MDNFKKTVGKNIVALRKTRGWSQERLAEAVNLSLNSIYLIEVGKTWMSYDTAIKLADAFAIPPERLFALETRPTIADALRVINEELGFMPPKPRRLKKTTQAGGN